MARSRETFGKKEVRNRKEKKRKDKEKKRQERKESETKSGLDDMIAYVDEFGNITDTPPDPNKKTEVKAEDIRLAPPSRDEDEDTTRQGIIKFFNESKGYGFIKDVGSQDSVFFHVNNLLDEVKEGNKVTFEIETGPKGASASQVRLVKD